MRLLDVSDRSPKHREESLGRKAPISELKNRTIIITKLQFQRKEGIMIIITFKLRTYFPQFELDNSIGSQFPERAGITSLVDVFQD